MDVCGRSAALSCLKRVEFNRKGRVFTSVDFALRQRRQRQNRNAARKRFLNPLHQFEDLRAREPVRARLALAVDSRLEICEELWGVLNFVDERGRPVRLEEQFRIVFGKVALVQIVERNVTTIGAFRQLSEHCRLASLTRSSNQNDGIFL